MKIIKFNEFIEFVKDRKIVGITGNELLSKEYEKIFGTKGEECEKVLVVPINSGNFDCGTNFILDNGDIIRIWTPEEDCGTIYIELIKKKDGEMTIR